MSLSRRDFLNHSAVAGLVLVGSTEMFTATALAAPGGDRREPGYWPLVDDPAGVLALPAGFSYAVVSRASSTLLESGEPTPGNHDGTGAFARLGGGTVLVNNHELGDTLAATPFPVPHHEEYTYDPGTPGGCTIVEADRDGGRVREYVGVAGTSTNCAGGVTPWGTWLTCEETEILTGQKGATKDHGYVFEVDPHDRAANRDPQPIKTLDRPADAGTPAAMAARDGAGTHVDDLSRATVIGTTYLISWAPVPDRDARASSTRTQLTGSEVTRGRKLEGAWWGDDGAWIVASFARDPGAVAPPAISRSPITMSPD